ncbi:hypothetical protein BDP27DRAFT_1425039 [Rhodocollybia butyracea]|uniref:Uncharacterized protein n=1 Tax=Rhodocollybia butyracea TaxID=206335 RepID=A0A9P5PNN7_9AGAR|nr:hypothetical protein BDP27DRAFT_1425039 [Rhodocollybia butyracea]
MWTVYPFNSRSTFVSPDNVEVEVGIPRGGDEESHSDSISALQMPDPRLLLQLAMFHNVSASAGSNLPALAPPLLVDYSTFTFAFAFTSAFYCFFAGSYNFRFLSKFVHYTCLSFLSPLSLDFVNEA